MMDGDDGSSETNAPAAGSRGSVSLLDQEPAGLETPRAQPTSHTPGKRLEEAQVLKNEPPPGLTEERRRSGDVHPEESVSTADVADKPVSSTEGGHEGKKQEPEEAQPQPEWPEEAQWQQERAEAQPEQPEEATSQPERTEEAQPQQTQSKCIKFVFPPEEEQKRGPGEEEELDRGQQGHVEQEKLPQRRPLFGQQPHQLQEPESDFESQSERVEPQQLALRPRGGIATGGWGVGQGGGQGGVLPGQGENQGGVPPGHGGSQGGVPRGRFQHRRQASIHQHVWGSGVGAGNGLFLSGSQSPSRPLPEYAPGDSLPKRDTRVEENTCPCASRPEAPSRLHVHVSGGRGQGTCQGEAETCFPRLLHCLRRQGTGRM